MYRLVLRLLDRPLFDLALATPSDYADEDESSAGGDVGATGGDFALAEDADSEGYELMTDIDRSHLSAPQELRTGFNVV